MKNGFKYNKYALVALALMSVVGCSSTNSVNDETASNAKSAETKSGGEEIAFTNSMLKDDIPKQLKGIHLLIQVCLMAFTTHGREHRTA